MLEDCALAIGARIDDVHAGLFGDVGCFSFYPVKHMTTAEGGMVITRSAELAVKLRHLRAFGVDRHMGERKIPGVYDVTALGFNYRMNEIEAAIGIGRSSGLMIFWPDGKPILRPSTGVCVTTRSWRFFPPRRRTARAVITA